MQEREKAQLVRWTLSAAAVQSIMQQVVSIIYPPINVILPLNGSLALHQCLSRLLSFGYSARKVPGSQQLAV